MQLIQSTLQDTQGRTFPYLRLSITDLCNFRCNYCLPEGCQSHSHSLSLSVDEIRRLVSVFAKLGVRKIRLTGGEPTLRNDFVEIVQTIKSIDGIETLAMTTNGYRMHQRVTDWLAAGIDAINVSVDSLDAAAFQMITGHNRLQEILQSDRDLENIGAELDAVRQKREYLDGKAENVLT